jgi:multidrug efflux system membrane fusion protein
VGLRLVDAGNIIHASDANGLLVITQMEPIAVIFTLPEDTLPVVNGRMRSGTSLPVKALSRDNGMDIASGTLLTIDNQIDQSTGTYRLKAVFDNKDRALWPNQFVNARLLTDVKKNATIIPVAAVQRGDQGSFVYRVNPSDNTAEVVPVTIGVTEGTIASVESGISANDLVVTDGQDRLRPGARVDPRTDTRPTDATNPPSTTQGSVPQSLPGSPRPQLPGGAQSFRSPGLQGNQPNGQTGNSQGSRTENRNRPNRQQ